MALLSLEQLPRGVIAAPPTMGLGMPLRSVGIPLLDDWISTNSESPAINFFKTGLNYSHILP